MKPYKTVLFLGDGMADEPIAELGGNGNFTRLRLGIGHGRETIDHVLSKFSESEKAAVDATLATGCKALEMLLRCGVAKAMNEYNSWSYQAPDEATDKAKETEKDQ